MKMFLETAVNVLPQSFSLLLKWSNNAFVCAAAFSHLPQKNLCWGVREWRETIPSFRVFKPLTSVSLAF